MWVFRALTGIKKPNEVTHSVEQLYYVSIAEISWIYTFPGGWVGGWLGGWEVDQLEIKLCSAPAEAGLKLGWAWQKKQKKGKREIIVMNISSNFPSILIVNDLSGQFLLKTNAHFGRLILVSENIKDLRLEVVSCIQSLKRQGTQKIIAQNTSFDKSSIWFLIVIYWQFL